MFQTEKEKIDINRKSATKKPDLKFESHQRIRVARSQKIEKAKFGRKQFQIRSNAKKGQITKFTKKICQNISNQCFVEILP
jgi:hypothetical protein